MARFKGELEHDVCHAQDREHYVCVIPCILEVIKALSVKLDLVISGGIDDTHHHEVRICLGGLLAIDSYEISLINIQRHCENVEEVHDGAEVVQEICIAFPLEDDEVF